MNEQYVPVVRLLMQAFQILTGIYPRTNKIISDDEARIGRLLMDAIMLLEGGTHALDGEVADEPS
jgi:hypothetical protein